MVQRRHNYSSLLGVDLESASRVLAVVLVEEAVLALVGVSPWDRVDDGERRQSWGEHFQHPIQALASRRSPSAHP